MSLLKKNLKDFPDLINALPYLSLEDTAEILNLVTEREKVIARDSLLNFTRYTFPSYEVAKCHESYSGVLQQFIEGDIKRLIISLPAQHGKALHVDTPVLTTEGFKKHGDLAPGDFVFDKHGNKRIVMATEPHYLRPNYIVRFDTGEEIIAADRHEWDVVINGHRIERRETKDLFFENYVIKPYIERPQDGAEIFIQSATPCGEQLVSCIQVDGGVYLAGETLIPTHNSELSSRRMPAYLFAKNPDLRLALCGYSDSFASKFNRQIQRIMDSTEYRDLFPEIQMASKAGSDGVRNNHEFEILGKRGSLISVGIGGALTGNPVDIAIIDDPYKDYEQAFSPVYREKVWEWYESVLEKRLHNDSKIIIVMTRWHEDDLVGRILKNVSEGKTSEVWHQVNFPAIMEGNKTEYDQREEGEALWPERHSLKKLLDSRRKNPLLFQAMDQGVPPNEGKKSFFDEFNFNKHVKPVDYRIDPNEELLLAYDFNRNPTSCLLIQKKLGVGVFILAEMQADGGTEALLEKQEWLKEIEVPKRIVGDNSGHSEKSSAKYTDYQLIKNFFRQGVEPVTHNANRRHVFSRMICNYIFRNVPVFINEQRCPKLVREIQNAKTDSKGGLLKNDSTDRNDLVDAMRYGFHYYFSSVKEVDMFLSTIPEQNQAA